MGRGGDESTHVRICEISFDGGEGIGGGQGGGEVGGREGVTECGCEDVGSQRGD